MRGCMQRSFYEQPCREDAGLSYAGEKDGAGVGCSDPHLTRRFVRGPQNMYKQAAVKNSDTAEQKRERHKDNDMLCDKHSRRSKMSTSVGWGRRWRSDSTSSESVDGRGGKVRRTERHSNTKGGKTSFSCVRRPSYTRSHSPERKKGSSRGDSRTEIPVGGKGDGGSRSSNQECRSPLISRRSRYQETRTGHAKGKSGESCRCISPDYTEGAKHHVSADHQRGHRCDKSASTNYHPSGCEETRQEPPHAHRHGRSASRSEDVAPSSPADSQGGALEALKERVRARLKVIEWPQLSKMLGTRTYAEHILTLQASEIQRNII
ncbi:hypothetical protein BESB_040670 [Besnoitia besnoiti]|uniref:Uncharacterized protein n=1 Tax=Besnoitia besnoiti TaxID=94643 RepID=A0A2A9MI83_BESBE|nr:hypothetical protein BESB_040670 [Besnoitia besnoiti]PFH37609.1 hypothetical protein BESB_040670 [Besnoitia besnoiti]